MNSCGSRGRRPGKPDTRAQILEVACRRFFEGGYQAVTLRSIAAEAGVDLALVSYYFGSKRGLLTAALDLGVNPFAVLGRATDGDVAAFPERALRALLSLWEDPETGAPLRALVAGAVREPAVADLVKEMMGRELIDKIAARIGGWDARERAVAFCGQLIGLIVTRYILRIDPIASMAADDMVRTYSPPLRVALGAAS
ncbi:hypothetical protein SRB17_80070 [Streptomyces sp. RB17]|uniref:TetR/AcrR family transcriptional regulator n=1 Tax=Streptomyces sp. RB17 TaxID=2585197 RepID=UPI00129554FF|nr:TetR family transcriptional regulator [Streptomyces sp. RB17]MQY39978.1 hypothetical protein [Streptomyces sp. RB17]